MITETLRELEAFYGKQQLVSAAEIVRESRYLYETDRAAFQRQMSTVDWWGGSGALWEMAFEERKADRLHKELIGRLVDALEAEDLAIPRALEIRDVFKQWRERGL